MDTTTHILIYVSGQTLPMVRYFIVEGHACHIDTIKHQVIVSFADKPSFVYDCPNENKYRQAIIDVNQWIKNPEVKECAPITPDGTSILWRTLSDPPTTLRTYKISTSQILGCDESLPPNILTMIGIYFNAHFHTHNRAPIAFISSPWLYLLQLLPNNDGIINTGVRCWVIAGIQGLLHCPAFEFIMSKLLKKIPNLPPTIRPLAQLINLSIRDRKLTEPTLVARSKSYLEMREITESLFKLLKIKTSSDPMEYIETVFQELVSKSVGILPQDLYIHTQLARTCTKCNHSWGEDVRQPLVFRIPRAWTQPTRAGDPQGPEYTLNRIFEANVTPDATRFNCPKCASIQDIALTTTIVSMPKLLTFGLTRIFRSANSISNLRLNHNILPSQLLVLNGVTYQLNAVLIHQASLYSPSDSMDHATFYSTDAGHWITIWLVYDVDGSVCYYNFNDLEAMRVSNTYLDDNRQKISGFFYSMVSNAVSPSTSLGLPQTSPLVTHFTSLQRLCACKVRPCYEVDNDLRHIDEHDSFDCETKYYNHLQEMLCPHQPQCRSFCGIPCNDNQSSWLEYLHKKSCRKMGLPSH